MQIEHFIDGGDVPSISGRTFETFNPATGVLLATVAFGEVEDVDRAVRSAEQAFRNGVWTNLAPAERARRMRAVAQLIVDHADEIALVESQDTGKPIQAARNDVIAAASCLEYFSQLPEHIDGRSYATSPGMFIYSRREPYGVVGAIAPWNFPFELAVWKTAAPLAAGNSVVIKMAEQTPASTNFFAKLCIEGGIPPGVVNVVHGDGETTGAALAAHPAVPKITFTGSTEVGRRILHAGADRIKSVHLELGGKTPNIIFEDADLDQALTGSLFTSFFNSGQICTAGSRLLLAEQRADEFLEAFAQRAGSLVVGDPLDAATQLGPVVSREQLDRVRGYIDLGQQEGARVLIGGGVPSVAGCASGYFVEPTIFVDVQQGMRIAQEEIFGPVLSVLTFASEDEAIAMANDVTYGLAATVWTTDLGRAFRLAERLEAGIIWTNCPHHGQWNVPYEGHKLSGLGEDLGLESMSTFTKLKVNHVNFGSSPAGWS